MSAARIAELERIIAARLISTENGARQRYDENGRLIVDVVTCGNCGMSWNDALVSSRTPAPGARCPYEYEHGEIKELARLKARRDRRRALAGVSLDGKRIALTRLTEEQARAWLVKNDSEAADYWRGLPAGGLVGAVRENLIDYGADDSDGAK